MLFVFLVHASFVVLPLSVVLFLIKVTLWENIFCLVGTIQNWWKQSLVFWLSMGSKAQGCPRSRGNRVVGREASEGHLQGPVTVSQGRGRDSFVADLGHSPSPRVSLLSHTCTRQTPPPEMVPI